MNNCDTCGWWNVNIPRGLLGLPAHTGECEVTLLLTNADYGCDSYENLQEAREDYMYDVVHGGDDG